MQGLNKCLELAQSKKIQLLIDPYDCIFVTIDQIDIDESGCGQCHKRYDVSDISGLIETSYTKKKHHYTARIYFESMVNCECTEKQKLDGLYHLDPNDDVFLKAHVEATKHCVCQRYVS
jgi:hypothetical protein